METLIQSHLLQWAGQLQTQADNSYFKSGKLKPQAPSWENCRHLAKVDG